MVEASEIVHEIRAVEPAARQRALEALEDGNIVFLPQGAFELSERERALLDPATVNEPRKHAGRARIIYEPGCGKVRKAAVDGEAFRALQAVMARYADWAKRLVLDLFPGYAGGFSLGPTSFRPCPRTGRQGLHVDSFFFVPTQGRRVLRVFTNVNPASEPRVWQVGEDRFEPFANRLLPRLKRELPGAWFFDRIGLTQGRRTRYDDIMRQLRNMTKRDREYQQNAPRRVVEFPSGSSWIVFTDGILHGALTGQHSFEQTFILDVDAMHEPARSPLRTLERQLGRRLV
jgi:hypothetical protein